MRFSDLILFLEKAIVENEHDPAFIFKKRAYNNVINKIQQSYSPKDTVTVAKIDAMPITQNMKNKLIQWSQCEPLQLVHNKEAPLTSKQTLQKELTNIMGIGAAGAQHLIDQGVRSVDDLRKPIWQSKLPEVTKVFLKYNPSQKIPHEHMVRLHPLICNYTEAGVDIVMVGSFRRNTPYSRDFDIMIVSDKPDILIQYEKYLSKVIGKTYRYSSGPDRISFLIEVPRRLLNTSTNMVYKFDIFRTPRKMRHSMLLYSTGSKLANIRMRSRAKRMGYLLNQEGLFNSTSGKKINIRSERGFFDALDMPYIEPEGRN